MSSAIFKLASKFEQTLAQAPAAGPVSLDNLNTLDPTKQAAYKQHLIRINEQAKILVDKVKEAIRLGVVRPEAQNYVDALKTAAAKYYNTATSPKPDGTKLKDLFKEEVQLYDRITKQYIDYKYEPLKKIRESLLYVGMQGPIKMWGSGSNTPQLPNAP